MTGPVATITREDPAAWEQVALVDILDRVLAAGVVITGDITLSIAGVDLVYISLQALVSSVRPGGPGPTRDDRR
ncbi:MAG TPA: gas vesicle protein [Micromonosporaceae bacterium]